ncbi:MAG: hypothetical protein JWM49_2174 [Microbacteriaceae bacterium]|nr:hypothetical protein [Microbacteriaceae bacterium]
MLQPRVRRSPIARILVVTFELLVVAAVAALGLLATGAFAVVMTHGVSMNPVYYQGDLVVVERANSYRVGEIVAYHLPSDNAVVLHRIIGIDPKGFRIKGDNNQSVDFTRPTTKEIIGHAVLHIPQGGTWLRNLSAPPILALAIFGLLTGGASARKRGHKRKRTTMSRHNRIRSGSFRTMPAGLRVIAAAAAALGVLGLTTAAFAWNGPLEQNAAAADSSRGRMDFSYTATVQPGAAYDGTTVTSPDPIFRTAVDVLQVHLAYHGESGSLSVSADLSTQDGWHTSVPLSPLTKFAGTSHETTVTLDLNALDARAQAGAAATGIPAGTVNVAVTAHILSVSGAHFTPALELHLSPLEANLVEGTQGLTITDPSVVSHPVVVERTLGMNNWTITVANARIVAIAVLLAAILGAVFVVIAPRRLTSETESEAIRRKYAPVLARVQPVSLPTDSRVVDVNAFATLAKIAERCGSLVLHWVHSGGETFIVQDENTTYRYQLSSGPSRR